VHDVKQDSLRLNAVSRLSQNVKDSARQSNDDLIGFMVTQQTPLQKAQAVKQSMPTIKLAKKMSTV